MIFILAQPILALKKLFRSTLLPKAVERRCIYYVIFPRKTTYSKTAKKKLGLWSYSLQGQEVNQVYCENALEFIQDFSFFQDRKMNLFCFAFHWKRHISTTYIPLKEKEWVYYGRRRVFVKAGYVKIHFHNVIKSRLHFQSGGNSLSVKRT